MSRIVLDFNKDFKFYKGDLPSAESIDFNDYDWEKVTVPHDWSIYGEFKKEYPSCSGGGFRPTGIAWYRKTFAVPNEYKGKIIELNFGGIYRKPTIFINGKKVTDWFNGYISKTVNISEYLNFGGENILAIKVDNSEQPSSRYYTGSGIYRKVNLIIRDKLLIKNLRPFITTPNISKNTAIVQIETEIENNFSENKSFELKYEIKDILGNIVSCFSTQLQKLASGNSVTLTNQVEVLNPKLWDTKNPNLYTLRTSVFSNGELTDENFENFGIRTIEFNKDNGFILNGEKTFIKGVCLHHDNGALGAAENTCADRRKLKVMKEMGVNAIRLAHNPFHESFLSLCDEMGFVVMDEFFDEWKVPKNPPTLHNDGTIKPAPSKIYSKYFDDNWEEDLISTVVRDRNHPSVVIYSIGNEIPEQWHTMNGAEQTAKILVDKVKEYDTTRPVTCACKFDNEEKTAEFCSVLDVVGYNYAEPLYNQHHIQFPDRRIIGSETISIAPFWKRSVNDLSVLSEVNRYEERSMGECFDTRSVRICSAEWSMHEHLKTPFVSGFFIWTGVDYLGEPTPHPWPSRSSYFGVTDTCCFPKDSYYFYKAFWSDEPVLHLLPHWNQNVEVGTVIDVIAYTNCKKAELFLNDESIGISEYDPQKGQHLSWKAPYIPGELKVVGLGENGEEIISDCICTAGDPVDIRLIPDKTSLKNDGEDTVFIRAEIIDEKGNIVPTAAEEITFMVDENLEIIGVDNGDPEYTGDLKSNKIPTLGGLALIIVKSKNKTGDFLFTAKVKDGLSKKIILSVK